MTLVDRVIRRLCEAITSRMDSPYIVSGKLGPYRSKWTIFNRGKDSWRLALHFFHRSDEDRELHTHPWKWGVALQLAGGYIEERRIGNDVGVTAVRPGMVNVFYADTAHRIDLLDERGSWSLILTGPCIASWGFLDRQTWTFQHWRDFIAAKGLAQRVRPGGE